MATHGERTPLPSRVLARILDHHKPLDYIWIAAFAAIPLLHAWLIGANRTSDGFSGYGRESGYDGQWPLFVLLLPLAAFVLRWVMNRIAPVSSSWPPLSLPSIVHLIDTEDGRRMAYGALRSTLLSPRNLIMALLVTAVIQVVDIWNLAGFYMADPAMVCEKEQVPLGRICANGYTVEKDWSVMFLSTSFLPESEMEGRKWQNLALNLSAYSVQFSLILIGVLLIVLIARHNLFFLSRVYQRRCVPAGEEHAYIHIDLDDDDRCFGFRLANDAFNTQVMALGAAAVFILFTRFNNVEAGSSLFPDAGQWLSVITWLAALGLVALPVMVKLLPRLPSRGGERPPASITGYLREFLSDDAWLSDDDPPPEEIEAVAARFAENAFWPTGNNRARQLFFLSFWVFFIALVPDPRAIESLQSFLPSWSMYVSWGVSGCFAWGATWLVFAFLKGMLSYVDDRLVNPPAHRIGENAARRQRRISIGLFISYRRADAAAYAGRLRDSLSTHMDRDRIFMDVDTILGGVDFQHAIEEAIGSAQAMLVVIGPQWLEAAGQDGHPRIQDPGDFVHQEVALGLKTGIRVLPVLVGGAEMPSEAVLPEDLKALARLNAREISNARWDYDVGKLLADVEKLRFRKKRSSTQESGETT